jgi:hypothetical protein
VVVRGRTGVFASLSDQTISFSFEASSSAQTDSINLTSSYGFLNSRGCDIAFFASSLNSDNCNSNSNVLTTGKTITKTFYITTDAGGVNESYGSINPYYDNLQLGTLNNP